MILFCNVCAHSADEEKFTKNDSSFFCPACGSQDYQKVEDEQVFDDPFDKDDTERLPVVIDIKE